MQQPTVPSAPGIIRTQALTEKIPIWLVPLSAIAHREDHHCQIERFLQSGGGQAATRDVYCQ